MHKCSLTHIAAYILKACDVHKRPRPTPVRNQVFTGWTWPHARARPFSINPAHISKETRNEGMRGEMTYLDRVRVGRPLCRVDELVCEALGDGLDVAERALAGLDLNLVGFRGLGVNDCYSRRWSRGRQPG